MWNFVIPHFERFLKELELSADDCKDADGKADRDARSLFAKYYPNRLIFDPSCYMKVGSYGKDTASHRQLAFCEQIGLIASELIWP